MRAFLVLTGFRVGTRFVEAHRMAKELGCQFVLFNDRLHPVDMGWDDNAPALTFRDTGASLSHYLTSHLPKD